jgi:hypothetical protein
MRILGHGYVLSAALVMVVAGGCAGAGNLSPDAATPARSADAARRVAPAPTLARPSAAENGAGRQVVAEDFRSDATTAGDWAWSGDACLTAGDASTPPTSVPACGSLAPQDPPGKGVLQLNPPNPYQVTLIGYTKALSTRRGLRIRWNLYSFDGDGSDGSLLWMTYGDKPEPTKPAGTGGHLGYTDGTVEDPRHRRRHGGGMAHAYLGIGFDEHGNFSAFLPGGPGLVPNTVAVAGAARIGYYYLTGVENASGQPVSLPFPLEDPSSSTRPKRAISIQVTIRRDGMLGVAFDIHDGNGYVTYLSKNIVGINGQPRVPRMVWVGINGSNGANYERRQIDDLTIGTLHL